MRQTAQVSTKQNNCLTIQSNIYKTSVFHRHATFQTHDPSTQPTKTKTLDPFPTQPNPRINPTHGQLWVGTLWYVCRGAGCRSSGLDRVAAVITQTPTCTIVSGNKSSDEWGATFSGLVVSGIKTLRQYTVLLSRPCLRQFKSIESFHVRRVRSRCLWRHWMACM